MSFSEEIYREINELPSPLRPPQQFPGRKDTVGIVIDNSTNVRDDAIWFAVDEATGDIIVKVYVPDFYEIISRSSNIYKEALKRVRTKINQFGLLEPMLPDQFVRDYLSLGLGEWRPTIEFAVTLNCQTLAIKKVDASLAQTIIRTEYDYVRASNEIKTNPSNMLSDWYDIAVALRENRMRISPVSSLFLKDNLAISAVVEGHKARVENEHAAALLVAEAMNLANFAASTIAQRHNLTGIYYNQKLSSAGRDWQASGYEPLPENTERANLVQPAFYDTENHGFVAQNTSILPVSSPLWQLSALINFGVIRDHILGNEPYYTKYELQQYAARLNDERGARRSADRKIDTALNLHSRIAEDGSRVIPGFTSQEKTILLEHVIEANGADENVINALVAEIKNGNLRHYILGAAIIAPKEKDGFDALRQAAVEKINERYSHYALAVLEEVEKAGAHIKTDTFKLPGRPPTFFARTGIRIDGNWLYPTTVPHPAKTEMQARMQAAALFFKDYHEENLTQAFPLIGIDGLKNPAHRGKFYAKDYELEIARKQGKIGQLLVRCFRNGWWPQLEESSRLQSEQNGATATLSVRMNEAKAQVTAIGTDISRRKARDMAVANLAKLISQTRALDC